MPIVQDGGRWRSVRTPQERQSSAEERINALSAPEKVLLEKALLEWQLTGKSILVDDVSKVDWEEQPLPVREWLLREDLIGETGIDMYPQLREDMSELFDGDYHEAILTGSIGWGKDYFATAACLRMLYELCCLRNPQHTLGLAAGEPIHIVPISRTVVSARRVVFGGICKKLALAPWFAGKYVETLEEVRFRDKGIYIVGGASQDGAALGLNVIFAIVDETNFMGDGKVTTSSASAKAEDKATMIYNALARRVKNRFKRHGVKGMVILVSSKRATTDFTERRIRAAIKANSTGVFVRDYAVWNVHPDPFKDQTWYRCAVSPKEGRCKVLEDPKEEATPGSLVFEFPHDYLDEFRNDPDGAARDFGGIATDFVGRLFITRRAAIDTIFDKQKANPFKQPEWNTSHILGIAWSDFMTKNARGEPVPICCSGAVRHVHIDMSTNQCGTGLCIGHLAGSVPVYRRNPEKPDEKVLEDAPVIHIDGVLRCVAPDGGDIDQGEVRGVVLRMISEGLPIRSASMDQYCGPPNLQMFKRRGLRVQEVGERVAKLRPMLTMRQAIYEQRIVSPFHPLLDRELKELEFDELAGKVRHPPKGSKDLADALAGVVHYITENMRGGGPLAPAIGVSAVDRRTVGAQWSTGGEVTWNDEDEGFDRVPPMSHPGQEGGGDGGFSSWIVKG